MFPRTRIGDLGGVIVLAIMSTLAAFWALSAQADPYRDGRFSFDISVTSDSDVAKSVLGNLLIQDIADGVKPTVTRWPDVPCYTAIASDDASLRQLHDLLSALNNRLGLKIEACTSGSSSAITYYFGHGQIGSDEKRIILELVRPVQEDNAHLSSFLHQQTSCYWHAHTENVDGRLNITKASVLVDLQAMDAGQMARCLFAGTAGSLGLTQVVPAHQESAPVNWGAVVETDLLSLFVLYHLKDEYVAGDRQDITTATEEIISAMHEMGKQGSP